MKDFVDEHWRDLVAIFIFCVGVGIGLGRPDSPLGLPLVMSALAVLKLPTKTNGGTNGQT